MKEVKRYRPDLPRGSFEMTVGYNRDGYGAEIGRIRVTAEKQPRILSP